MTLPIIDAHIHLDHYEKDDQTRILQNMSTFGIEALIAVSWDLRSAKQVSTLSTHDERVKPAFGFHPEQPYATDRVLSDLLAFINQRQEEIVAIGEVGLPYYLRKQDPTLDLQPYIEQLETWIKTANHLNLPIVLHAVYDDATIVCDMLEKHSVKQAHFHWFKGDIPTVERMITNNYFISITPDVLYEQEIRDLVEVYPLSLMMVETDGPWPFSGPFSDELTHPKMIHHTIKEIARLKRVDLATVYQMLYENTKQFYKLK